MYLESYLKYTYLKEEPMARRFPSAPVCPEGLSGWQGEGAVLWGRASPGSPGAARLLTTEQAVDIEWSVPGRPSGTWWQNCVTGTSAPGSQAGPLFSALRCAASGPSMALGSQYGLYSSLCCPGGGVPWSPMTPRPQYQGAWTVEGVACPMPAGCFLGFCV